MLVPISDSYAPMPGPCSSGQSSLVGLGELVAGGKPASIFVPVQKDPAQAILHWRDGFFMNLLGPTFRDAWLAAAAMQFAELRAAELNLDAGMQPVPLRENSTTAGKGLLGALRTVKGDRVLKRYASAVASGDLPGHFAVVAALFLAGRHYPLRQACTLWLSAELHLAGQSLTKSPWVAESVNSLIDDGARAGRFEVA